MRLCVGPGAVTTLPLAASVPSHALQAMQMTSRHAILDRPTLWDSLRDAMEIPNRSVGGLTISRPASSAPPPPQAPQPNPSRELPSARSSKYRQSRYPAIPLSRYPAIPLELASAHCRYGAAKNAAYAE